MELYSPFKRKFKVLGDYAIRMNMRIDFHPDHFVVLNSPEENIFKQSVKTLQMHRKLLKGMGIEHKQRCVMHVGADIKIKSLH